MCHNQVEKSALVNNAPSEQSKTNSLVRRNKSDYAVMAVMFVLMYLYGIWAAPRTVQEDRDSIMNLFYQLGELFFGVKNSANAGFGAYFLTGTFFLTSSNLLFHRVVSAWYPETMPQTHVVEQFKGIFPNTILLLPALQAFADYLVVSGVTLQTIGRTDPVTILVDCLTWSLGFELSWYMQHRLMHEVKWLWTYGHEYHHTWRRPEHMLGITNFAFDHLVEPWVTMSSSFIPIFLFPSNFFVAKLMSVLYMVLAILVHWNAFPYRYHLNHHYKVTANYGSHVPIFDIMFGTYYWENTKTKSA